MIGIKAKNQEASKFCGKEISSGPLKVVWLWSINDHLKHIAKVGPAFYRLDPGERAIIVSEQYEAFKKGGSPSYISSDGKTDLTKKGILPGVVE